MQGLSQPTLLEEVECKLEELGMLCITELLPVACHLQSPSTVEVPHLIGSHACKCCVKEDRLLDQLISKPSFGIGNLREVLSHR